MPDSELIKRIGAAFERADEIDLHHNRIEIVQNDTLRLEGEVENIMVKRRAAQLARQIANGATVEDRLLLRVEKHRTGEALQQAVTEALMSEPAFRNFRFLTDDTNSLDRNDWVGIKIDDSRVQLRGQVNSLSHRRLAEVIAWWVPGTADVENRIHVQPPQQDSDNEISDIIRLVFEKDPSLDAQQIRIRTRQGAVHLEGVVSSEVNRRIASYDCWYIPGVHQVKNMLQVRPPG